MKRKKLLALVLALCLATSTAFIGCSRDNSGNDGNNVENSTDKNNDNTENNGNTGNSGQSK